MSKDFIDYLELPRNVHSPHFVKQMLDDKHSSRVSVIGHTCGRNDD